MEGNIRDVSVTFFAEDIGVIVACDSSASIGLKKHDQLSVPPEITSAFCLRVPLMEILALGGIPQIVVDTIGGEMNPTGERMLSGMKQELEKAGFGNVLVNGSTEENMLTTMTSVGVTVIGSIKKADFTYGKISSNSVLYQVGIPYVGAEVLEHKEELFSYQDLAQLRKQANVLEMVPVGSKGIAYEADQLAKSSRLFFKQGEEVENLNKSAGPATVLLVAVSAGHELVLENKNVPIKAIGSFIHRENI